jgi:hypothetical protein
MLSTGKTGSKSGKRGEKKESRREEWVSQNVDVSQSSHSAIVVNSATHFSIGTL